MPSILEKHANGAPVDFVLPDPAWAAQTEALALGDRLAVMRAGAIEHLGPPVEVFGEPRTRYLADFVGFLNGIEIEPGDGHRRRHRDQCQLYTIDGERISGCPVPR